MFTMLIHLFGISGGLYHGGMIFNKKIPFLVDYIGKKWSYWPATSRILSKIRKCFCQILNTHYQAVQKIKNRLHQPGSKFWADFGALFLSHCNTYFPSTVDPVTQNVQNHSSSNTRGFLMPSYLLVQPPTNGRISIFSNAFSKKINTISLTNLNKFAYSISFILITYHMYRSSLSYKIRFSKAFSYIIQFGQNDWRQRCMT